MSWVHKTREQLQELSDTRASEAARRESDRARGRKVLARSTTIFRARKIDASFEKYCPNKHRYTPVSISWSKETGISCHICRENEENATPENP